MSEVAKDSMELSWKEHSVDLEAFNAAIKAQDSNCCGTSADSNKLTVHFIEQASEEAKAAVAAQWAELDDEEHAMCASYKSQAQKASEKEALKASGKAALIALGLSEAQVNAMLGQ